MGSKGCGLRYMHPQVQKDTSCPPSPAFPKKDVIWSIFISSKTLHQINISDSSVSRITFCGQMLSSGYWFYHKTYYSDITQILFILTHSSSLCRSILLQYPATWLCLSPCMAQAGSVRELNHPGTALNQGCLKLKGTYPSFFTFQVQ